MSLRNRQITNVSLVSMLVVVNLVAFIPNASSEATGGYNSTVFNQGLLHLLEGLNATDSVEVIVQFRTPRADLQRSVLEEAGLEVKHVFHVIPAAYAVGPKSAVLRLSHYPSVKWVEYNAPIHYLMEESTYTINASATWYTDVLDENGNSAGYIDGTGVTAVVLDSGVDAGHPDLDYGKKTIMNLKSDSNMVWYEMENTDTSSGHGTHCAGTIAGNGDASAGARRGVAPGAKLIGLSTGEAVSIINALGALEWVYDHTKPNANPYNIRVVSNSWGTSGDYYDPNDAIAQVTEKLTYENNVVVVFAAGNDGGDGKGYDDGSGNIKPHTNPYSNTPAAIGVAAMERDGSGVADFSSRGLANRTDTYPDIGAPGVKIWSTAARRTLISLMTKRPVSDINPYYFAISGTSMATPHISGVVALLWQACPELRTSYIHEDYNGPDRSAWDNDTNTRVHEAELILEAAGRYILPDGSNGVPGNATTGHWGQKMDFAQGYGLIDVKKAVGIALTLHKLRTMDRDNDGNPDYPNVTVRDAIDVYDGKKVLRKALKFAQTDTLVTHWRGEWTRFNNQSNKPEMWTTDESHYLYIPKEASELKLELKYSPIDITDRLQVSSLFLTIDANMDGTVDWTQSDGSITEGYRTSTLPIDSGSLSSYRGRYWNVRVEGRGIGFNVLDFGLNNGIFGEQYKEIMVEYEVSASIRLEPSNLTDLGRYARENGLPEYPMLEGRKGLLIRVGDTHSIVGQWEPGNPSGRNSTGMLIVIEKEAYDLGKVSLNGGRPIERPQPQMPIWPFIVLLALALAGIYAYIKRKDIMRRIGR